MKREAIAQEDWMKLPAYSPQTTGRERLVEWRGMHCEPDVEKVCEMMATEGLSIEEQMDELLVVMEKYAEVGFGEACMEKIERMERLLDRREEYFSRKKRREMHRTCIKKEPKKRAVVTANLSFVWCGTARGVGENELMTTIEKLEKIQMISNEADTATNLRRAMGVQHQAEMNQKRKKVKWIGPLNALHAWVDTMIDHKLIETPTKGDSRWIVAADCFCDENGMEITNSELSNSNQIGDKLLNRVQRTVPR